MEFLVIKKFLNNNLETLKISIIFKNENKPF